MKITVVTVCYNCASEIEATIQSVINQTYKDIEYIIIDGASKDGTLDIINRYADRITKIVSEPDHGIYDAMNKAIDLATGDWINFMNAGDTFAGDTAIEDFFKIADTQEPNDILYGDTILVYPFGRYYKDCHPEGSDNQWCHQSVFARMTVMKKLKFDLSYKVMADRNFIYQATHNGSRLIYYPSVVSCYKNYDGLSTTRGDLMTEEFYKIEDKKKDWNYWWYKINYFRHNTLHIYRFWKKITDEQWAQSLSQDTRLTKID